MDLQQFRQWIQRLGQDKRITAAKTGNASASQGAWVNTGVINGPVTVAAAVRPAQSVYLRQVERIAPRELLDRADELAELTQFCTSPDIGSYLWFRAPAWAGKSALMSWFVLHPPANVRVVSFFITARLAGSSDRNAFLEAVVEQLADLLDEPVPAHQPEVIRDAYVLDRLAAAAKRSSAAGVRLILVVDGLDEDRGVTAGEDAHSIAALLPANPVAGLRVIVASRPDPPIPIDVPEDHPLRDPRIVRRLRQSPLARRFRLHAEGEIKRLLGGTRTERDLLGLLTAALGGMSATDLADLTDTPGWVIDDHLATVTGRSFTRRPSRWAPGVKPDVYLLGHEELLALALRLLSGKRLDDYRGRLHGWADRYCRSGWPSDTPEYLLQGYHRMLHATGDVRRMVKCSVDPARHERMYLLSGSDAAALTEISVAMDAVLADAPDLSILARLAIHRDFLLQRNANLPVRIPAVWASLGRFLRAEALARSIADPGNRARALVEVACVVSGHGDDAKRVAIMFEDAMEATRDIREPRQRISVLCALADTAIAARDHTRAQTFIGEAEGAAHALNDPLWSAQSAIDLVAVCIRFGAEQKASNLLDLAEAAARSISAWMERVAALANVATLLSDARHARAGFVAAGVEYTVAAHAADIGYGRGLAHAAWAWHATGNAVRAEALGDRAVAVARTLSDPAQRAMTLTTIARTLARTGRLQLAEDLIAEIVVPDMKGRAASEIVSAWTASGAIDRAADLAESIPHPYWRSQATASVVQALADIDMYDPAVVLANSIADLSLRAHALADLAHASVASNRQYAEILANRAEQTARSAIDPNWQAQCLVRLASALAIAGHAGRAASLADCAHVVIGKIADSDARACTLIDLTEVNLTARRFDEAESIAKSIVNPFRRAQAVATLVAQYADDGGRTSLDVLIDQLQQSVDDIADQAERVQAIAGAARAVATTLQWGRAATMIKDAQSTTSTIMEPSAKGLALANIAAAIAADNRSAAVSLAASIQDPYWSASALLVVARAMVHHGEKSFADVVLEHIMQIALPAVLDPSDRDALVRDLAAILILAGRLDDASRIADAVTEPRARALALLAALPASGYGEQDDRAAVLLVQAEDAAQHIVDPSDRALALVALAKHVDSAKALRLLGEAFRIANWTTPLPMLAMIADGGLISVTDEFLSCSGAGSKPEGFPLSE